MAKLEADLGQAQKDADALSRAIEELQAQLKRAAKSACRAKARRSLWARR